MKSSIKILVLAIVLQLTACGDEVLDPKSRVLTGRWKLAETLADPGDGSGKWTKVSADSNQFLEFKENGELAGSAASGFATYAISDSTKLTFIKKDGLTIQNYFFQFNEGYLQMSPAGPIYCIEGAATGTSRSNDSAGHRGLYRT